MRKKMLYVLSLLHGVLLIAGILPAFAAVPLALTKQYDLAAEFPFAFAVYIPFFGTYAASRKCRSIFSFLLFSAVSVVPLFLIPMHPYLRGMLCILTAWVLLVRIIFRVKEDGKDLFTTPSILTIAVFAALTIIGIVSGIDLIRNVNYVLTFLYVILILLHRNLVNLEKYFEVNSNIENIPKKQIARTNTGAMILTVGAVSVFMILFPLIGIDKLLVNIGNALLDMIRAIVGKIDIPFDYIPESTTVDPETHQADLIPTGHLPEWAEIIFSVLRIMLAVIFGGILLGIIAYGIYSLIKRFYRPYRDNEDLQEFIQDDPDVKESLFREVVLKRMPFLDLSAEGTIRRTYKKTIEKGLSKQKKRTADVSALSPEELEDAAALEQDEKRSLLHETYEKARYSNEPLTKDDVKKVRG